LSKQPYFQIRPNALSAAAEEWYNELDPEVKEWVDEKVEEMRETARAKNSERNIQFGVAGARETLCALIAICEGWRLKEA
jgi:hypothetical protein